MQVCTEIKNRGVEEIYIACVDGLKGFTEAINTIYPHTTVQLCVVHMIINSLKYVSYKDRKTLTSDLKLIYSSVNEEEAILNLESFEDKWANKYPVIEEM